MILAIPSTVKTPLAFDEDGSELTGGLGGETSAESNESEL